MRLFVALLPPPELAESLAAGAERALAGTPGVRLCPVRDLHLTLLYFGELADERVEAFRLALTEELRGMAAPELRFAGAGGFPDERDPRVLFADAHEEHGGTRLETLVGRARQAALSFGWREPAQERGRPFRPHVTLARRRTGGDFRWPLDLARELPGKRWLPVEVNLVHSRPERPEARYTSLAAVPLVVRPG